MSTAQQKKKFTAGSIFNFGLLTKVLRLTKAFRGKLYLAFALTSLVAFLGPVRPYLIQYTIDHHIAQYDMQGVIQMGSLIFFLLLMQAAVQIWGTILTNYIGQQVIRNLRLHVFDYLTGLRVRFYDKTPVGTLVTRTVSDIETIADVFSEGLINIVGDLLQIVFILIIMFSTDWKLSLVALSVLPLLLYAGYLFKEKVRISFEDVRNQVARLNTFVHEHIQGMQIVQLFNREQTEMQHFDAINRDHRDANIRSVMYYSVFFPVVEIIAAISTALILWYGSHGVLNDHVSVGTIIAFIMYINLFFRPIRQLADRFNTMQMGMVAADRIFKLTEDTSQLETSGTTPLTQLEGRISFADVSFAYAADTYVLHDIAFDLAPGKSLALVGATGSGKSSIINLLSGFYTPNTGIIRIDNKSLADLDLQDVRSKMAVVLQDVFLFSGSIIDNIRLFDPNISEEEIIATAKLLGAHHFISKLPNGYHQQVQERGLTLSVGQRQLISFIRAMVTQPAVLILDEATAAIDHETEEVIQNAIRTMMAGRTSIIIAHRLSTIQHVDEILVLDQGRIVERGNHNSLLQTDSFYKKLYDIQFAFQQTG